MHLFGGGWKKCVQLIVIIFFECTRVICHNLSVRLKKYTHYIHIHIHSYVYLLTNTTSPYMLIYPRQSLDGIIKDKDQAYKGLENRKRRFPSYCVLTTDELFEERVFLCKVGHRLQKLYQDITP